MALSSIEQPVPRKTRQPSRKRVTLDAFLNSPDETFSEWVDGEVITLSVTDRHQDMAEFLAALLRFVAEAHDLGVVRTAPFAMKLVTRPSGREPDVVFVANENRKRITTQFLEGPADIVIEIISPESRTRDRRDKFFEYAQGGVKEYWLLDYERKRAEFFQLGEDGTYYAMPVSEEGVFRSELLPGFWLQIEWLWQEPLPKLMTVLKAWNMA